MKKAVLVLLSFVLFGCAASGDVFSGFKQPNGDNGMVYVYRPHQFVGGGVSFDVGVDDAPLGVLRNGGYLEKELPSGVHFVTANTEVSRVLKVDEPKAGFSCVKLEPAMGFLVARPSFSAVDNDTCAFEIKGTKKSQ